LHQDTPRSAPSTATSSLNVSGLLLLVGLTVVWGSNWPVMKIAMAEIPVWWFRAACLVCGGLGLLGLAALSGNRLLLKAHEIPPLLLTAAFAVAGWHVCSAFGVSLMPAGRAVIIAFTMPVWAAIASAWLLGEKMTVYKAVGFVLGLAGLAILIGPDLAIIGAAPIGALFMLVAAMSWGLGTVLFKRFNWSVPVLTNMGWQLTAASIPVTAIAFATSPPPDVTALSQPVVWAMVYVLLLPMTFGQWAYFKIVNLFPASVAALGTLAIPVVGVYSSVLLLGEPAGWREAAALGLICSALAAILIAPTILERRRRRA